MNNEQIKHVHRMSLRTPNASLVRNEVQLCLPGPSDVTIHWLVNGHVLDRPITESRQSLGPRGFLVSSWLREGPLLKDARYRCIAEASTGNDMSELNVHLSIRGIRPSKKVPILLDESLQMCSTGAAINVLLSGR